MNKKILIVSGLIFLLLNSARVIAFDDTSHTDSLWAKMSALEDKVKANNSKIEALEAKMNRLEGWISANDAKVGDLAARMSEIQLESRVSDLEIAQNDMKNSGNKSNK